MRDEMALHRAAPILGVGPPEIGTPSYEYGTPLSTEKPVEKKPDTSSKAGLEDDVLSGPLWSK